MIFTIRMRDMRQQQDVCYMMKRASGKISVTRCREILAGMEYVRV